MRKGLLIVVSGASGTGKGTVCRRLLDDSPDLVYSISATTRKPRDSETHGVEYFFLTHDQFEKMITENAFLEYANVYGNYYGTPRGYIDDQRQRGRDVLLEIDVQGAINVQQQCPDGVFIFLLPPSIEVLRQRIIGRGTETPESIERRLNNAAAEIEVGHQYDYVVVNDEVSSAVDTIKSIIVAERCRVALNENLFDALKRERND